MSNQGKYANDVFDAATQLSDGATTISASANGQVGGADRIVDLMQGLTQFGAGAGGVGIDDDIAYFEGDWWISPTILDFGTGDEVYSVQLEFSDVIDFASGVIIGPVFNFGLAGIGADVDKINLDPQRIGFDNRINGVNYQFVRVRTIVAGTTPSFAYGSNLTKRP